MLLSTELVGGSSSMQLILKLLQRIQHEIHDLR